MSDAPQKISGLAGVTLGACVLFTFPHSHLCSLTLSSVLFKPLPLLRLASSLDWFLFGNSASWDLVHSLSYRYGVFVGPDCLAQHVYLSSYPPATSVWWVVPVFLLYSRGLVWLLSARRCSQRSTQQESPGGLCSTCMRGCRSHSHRCVSYARG